MLHGTSIRVVPLVYVKGIGLLYRNMKSTHNFSLITIFLLIFTRAMALVKIRRKMVIHKKWFVNFIKSGVIIDTNSI